jgi:single-strand DNA-binding protein
MLNKFLGIGRNTKDGEYRTTDNNLKIYTNTIAITNDFKNKDGNYDSEFINYIAYKNTAEYLNKYSSKGTLINIVGRIHTRSYEDKDKVKKYVTEIIVESASVLEKKTQEPTLEEIGVPDNYTTDYKEPEIQLLDSDLPF